LNGSFNVNFSTGIFLTPNANIIPLGLGPTLLSYFVFGGWEEVISAVIPKNGD
jgi:hypothetical protein